MKHVLLTLLLLVIVSCKNSETEKKDTITKTSSFTTYQMSEMAALMEKMYKEHEVVKQHIINGESVGDFPEYYLDIHQAAFTDETDNDQAFKDWAKLYIETEQQLYKSDTENLVTNYNAGVQVCLMCHSQKCGGPIPRIKKLLIK